MGAAIICEQLSKRYLLGEEVDVINSLSELALRFAQQGPQRPAAREEVWALRDLDLEVAEGDVLGIVGRNGAGKSTLLKVLSRITTPTSGRARVRGRVGALLEVGTAFDPELTGRENILINGALLGMSRRDIRRRFDDIVEFSGIGAFIDTPVKRYSSGMYLRLGFAVAAHMEPEVMVVDEVLAVGDAEFQRRCLNRMSELGRGGRTILYVSHDLGSLAHLASRCVWIDAGSVRMDGDPGEVIATYLREGVPSAQRLALEQRGPCRLTGLTLRDPSGAPVTASHRGDALTFGLTLDSSEQMHRLDVSIWVIDHLGRRILDEAFLDDPSRAGDLDAPGTHVVELALPPLLAPGTYTAGVWIGDNSGTHFDGEALRFDVVPNATDRPEAVSRSRMVSPPLRWRHDR